MRTHSLFLLVVVTAACTSTTAEKPRSDPPHAFLGTPAVPRQVETRRTFACGGARCAAGEQVCCDDGKRPPMCAPTSQVPDWCSLLNTQRSCDAANEPCAQGERCCEGKIGHGPLTITRMCMAAANCPPR